MTSVVAVSAVPIAVAFVVGVGAFVALLPLLIADQRRVRPLRSPATATEAPVAARATVTPPLATPLPLPLPLPSVPATAPAPVPAPAPVLVRPRASRLRVVVSVGALVAWSVWSVHRPHDRGRHD